MGEHVLVPVDGSEYSITALEFALEKYPDAEITVLHVFNPTNVYLTTNYNFRSMIYNQPPERIDEAMGERAEEILEETIAAADVEDRDLNTEWILGDAATGIVKYIDDNDVDMVVVGSRGMSKVKRMLLGSVAEKVIRRSSVPVTVVR